MMLKLNDKELETAVGGVENTVSDNSDIYPFVPLRPGQYAIYGSINNGDSE